MVVCGIALLFSGLLWIRRRKYLQGQWKKVVGILLAASALGCVEGVAMRLNMIPFDGSRLERRENGKGDYERKLGLGIEGREEEIDYVLTVPEQLLSEEEERGYLALAREEIAREFAGENASQNCVREKVVIHDTYQGGKVGAEWSFDNYKIMDREGNVIGEEILEEGELVGARVTLTCGSSVEMEEFYFRVFPKILGEEESFFAQLEKLLIAQGERRGESFLELPGKVGGYRLKWREKKDWTPEKILLFGVVLALFVPLLQREREKEQKKRRACLLELEYSDMVSKMALLLSSGMTVQGAWKKIAFSYEKKRGWNETVEMPVYEEMLIACREIENGMEEVRAYGRFGDRCGQAAYRRFSNILTQNLRKGGCALIGLLEEEAQMAFEERKRAAKKYGEEAGTKLLFPMMIMLAIVMMILIVPAMSAFQI